MEEGKRDSVLRADAGLCSAVKRIGTVGRKYRKCRCPTTICPFRLSHFAVKQTAHRTRQTDRVYVCPLGDSKRASQSEALAPFFLHHGASASPIWQDALFELLDGPGQHALGLIEHHCLQSLRYDACLKVAMPSSGDSSII